MKKVHFSMLALFLVTLIMIFIRKHVHTYQITTPALNVICVWLIALLVMLLPGYITSCVSKDSDMYFIVSFGIGIVVQIICFLLMLFDAGAEGVMTGFITSALNVYIEPMVITLIIGSGIILGISWMKGKRLATEEVISISEDEEAE